MWAAVVKTCLHAKVLSLQCAAQLHQLQQPHAWHAWAPAVLLVASGHDTPAACVQWR